MLQQAIGETADVGAQVGADTIHGIEVENRQGGCKL
jgi:hypothetical protein